MDFDNQSLEHTDTDNKSHSFGKNKSTNSSLSEIPEQDSTNSISIVKAKTWHFLNKEEQK